MDAGQVTRWSSRVFGALLLIITPVVVGAIERQLREIRDASTSAARENDDPSATESLGEPAP